MPAGFGHYAFKGAAGNISFVKPQLHQTQVIREESGSGISNRAEMSFLSQQQL